MKIILRLTLAVAVLTIAQSPIASAHWPDQAPHQFAYLGEFELVVFGIDPGQIGPVVETPFGFHVIQRLEAGL